MTQERKVIVLGGGAAGLEAARGLARAGVRVLLVEKENSLGGRLRELSCLYPGMEDPAGLLEELVGEVTSSPRVEVLMGATVKEARRLEDGFEVTVAAVEEEVRVRGDGLVVATGAALFDARKCGEYGYGRYPGVVTSLEFEGMLKRQAAGEEAITPRDARVAFIQCVGSRQRAWGGRRGWPYCSRVCCMYTARQARRLKELLPEATCYVFYMDVRAAGPGYEEFWREAVEKQRLRYVRGRPGKVFPDGAGLLVRAEDTLMGSPLELEVDLVVLAAALEPHPETVALAGMLGLRRDAYGFLAAAPEGTPLEAAPGVFFAGACGFPKSVAESRAEGLAAAGGLLGYLERLKGDGDAPAV